MNILIDDDVRAYLGKKSCSSITVDSAAEMSCCIQVPLPLIVFGEPRKKQNEFSVHHIDGITVYLNKFLPYGETVRFLLRNYFIKKAVIVDGVRMC